MFFFKMYNKHFLGNSVLILCVTLSFTGLKWSSADKNRSENLCLNANVRSDIVSDHVITVTC